MDGKHLKPGDTVVMVDRWRGRAFSTQTVQKVGRTWITLGCGRRLTVNTLEGEDRSWTFYLTMADYERNLALSRLWNQFRHKAAQRYELPSGVTEEKIHQAAQLLGLA